LGPRIVILDEVELSDDQLRRLEGLGRLVRHTTNPTGESEVVRRLDGAEVAILGWTALGRRILSQFPELRLIAVWATGYDYVDVAAANDQGIVVTNVPAYAGRAVAELTIGLVLVLARHIVPADRSVRDGRFSWRGFQGTELAGKVLGVVGVGDIGREVARLGACLGMHVLGHARTPSAERATQLGVELLPLHELLHRSDVVSLHVPLTAETHHLVGRQELATMRPGAFLVNTARAGVVDQAALVDALRTGRLGGAALDDHDHPAPALAALPNVVLTPHIGFCTAEALVRKGDVCVRNVASFLEGKPQNVIS
jgi:phosphoglycerate dehydrogenase-like enzyme